MHYSDIENFKLENNIICFIIMLIILTEMKSFGWYLVASDLKMILMLDRRICQCSISYDNEIYIIITYHELPIYYIDFQHHQYS